MRHEHGFRRFRPGVGGPPANRAFVTAALCLAGIGPAQVGCRQRSAPGPIPPRQVVLLVDDPSAPYEADLIQGAREAVGEVPDTELTVLAVRPHGAVTSSPTIDISFSLIGILVACEPTNELNEQIHRASAKGVPVYVIGNLFPSEEMEPAWTAELTVACEAELAGADGAQALLAELTRRGVLEAGCKIAVLQRPGNERAASLRTRGFRTGSLLSPVLCRMLPAVTIDGPEDEAIGQIASLLREHSDLRMILTTHGDLLLPAARAVEKVGPPVRPAIGGFEATPANRKALAAGRIQMLVDVQPARLARRAAVFLLHRDRSENPLGAPVYVPGEIITPETLVSTTSTAPASAPVASQPATRPQPNEPPAAWSNEP